MWRPEGWENPYEDIDESVPKCRVGIVMGKGIGYEEGADAMLELLFKLAKESPTKTFTIDSRVTNIFEVQDE